MPLYYFKCDTCERHLRKLMSPEEASKSRSCVCPNGKLVRDPHPPSSRVTEVIDNGVMTKSLERLADADRLFKERHDAVEKQVKGEK